MQPKAIFAALKAATDAVLYIRQDYSQFRHPQTHTALDEALDHLDAAWSAVEAAEDFARGEPPALPDPDLLRDAEQDAKLQGSLK